MFDESILQLRNILADAIERLKRELNRPELTARTRLTMEGEQRGIAFALRLFEDLLIRDQGPILLKREDESPAE